jgi:CTP synthase
VLNLASILNEPSLGEWTSRAELCDNLHVPVRIAVVGKYTGLSDAYLSVLKVDITHYLSVDSVWITK